MAAAKMKRPLPASATRAALDAARGDLVSASTVARTGKPSPGSVVLPPSAFADDWKGRPVEPTKIGLRLVSESVNERAKAEATASADRYYPDGVDRDVWAEHWNGKAMRGVLAQAVCQHDDVDTSWFRAMADDMIAVAFNEKGIARLWQAYQELRERLSPLLRLAEEDDVLDLARRLAEPGAVDALPGGDRRLLARILDDMRERAG